MKLLAPDFETCYRNSINELKDLGVRMWTHEISTVNLIASDNAYPAQSAEYPVYHGNIIQEGLLGHRPFAGAELHDELERLGVAIACQTFGAQHANLQPHSCSQANQAVKQSSSSNTIRDEPQKPPPSTRSSTTQETTCNTSGN